MFGITKNNPTSTPAPTPTPGSSQGQAHDIYIMPEKFQVKGESSLGRPLTVALIGLGAVIIITGIYFLYDYWQIGNKKVATVPPKTTIQQISDNEVVNINTPATTVATSTPTTTPETTTTTPSGNLGSENPNLPPAFSSDADSDGLTDVEENIIGSSSAKPDTDGDGYIDGQELQNGYSPIVAGSEKGKLSLALFIQTLATNFTDNNFQIFVPKDWSANIVPASRQVIITSNTGEIIRISEKLKDKGVTAAGWYLQNNPGISLGQLRIVTAGTIQGVFSPNGLHAYLADTDSVNLYVFDYIMEDNVEFRYPTIFTMLVKSLQPISEPLTPSPVATSTPTSTPPATSTQP